MNDFRIRKILFPNDNSQLNSYTNNQNNDNVVSFFSKEELNGMQVWAIKDKDGKVSYCEENGKAIRFK